MSSSGSLAAAPRKIVDGRWSIRSRVESGGNRASGELAELARCYVTNPEKVYDFFKKNPHK